MPAKNFSMNKELFKSDLDDNEAKLKIFQDIYKEKNGNWQEISSDLLEKDFKTEVIGKLRFTHNLLDLTSNNEKLVQSFQKDRQVNSLMDIALNFDTAKLQARIKQANPKIENEDALKTAIEIHKALFLKEPTATIVRMAENNEEEIDSSILSNNVAIFLRNQPSFNIKTTSIYHAINSEQAFKDIPKNAQEELISELKSLQRVATISPVAKAIPVLLKTNMDSALKISEVPESQFVSAFSESFGEDGENVARQIHYNAVNVRIRNEQAIIALKEAGEGTGVAFIDQSINKEADTEFNDQSLIDRIASAFDASNKSATVLETHLEKHVNPSWDVIFGDADYCDCGECTSVYSAAAYFVELLQYLRNNNLDPHLDLIAKKDLIIKSDPKNIKNTPLEKLLNRRPDLKHLELSCNNTNTILPYIDLVNEVMESFVVFQEPLPVAFNTTEDETSGELLSQPQHTEEEAYCILHKAVFPFSLPYHQPIDAARIYLDYLGTSRYELIETFQLPRKGKKEILGEKIPETCSIDAKVAADESALDKNYQEYLTRAVDAEFLGLTQDEYIILAKEAFVSKEYWDRQSNNSHSEAEYHARIGVKPIYQYYGYESESELINGLTLVKEQFLPRTGIEYADLVELLNTQFLNPSQLPDKVLGIMESIRINYTSLYNELDTGASNLKAKYKKLIAHLLTLPSFANQFGPSKDLEKWIYCWFERAGKAIVLKTHGKKETCSLDPVRLIHLDGTPLSTEEYDRFHRFIRLWKKLGWTIDETDKAIIGLGGSPKTEIDELLPDIDSCDNDCGDLFDSEDDCDDSESDYQCSQIDTVNDVFSITPNFLHQLVAVKKLLDQTGLELIKLLTFWTDISTVGENSLYKKLFLTHNLIGLDKIFKADESGSYLTKKNSIKEQHEPVVMASLRLSSDDIAALQQINTLTDSIDIETFWNIGIPTNELTLKNLSLFYRFRLLANILGIKIPELIKILPLFRQTNPFFDANSTVKFLDQWTKVEEAGFDYLQLNYIIENRDDKNNPFTPAPRFILQLAKTIYDGLNNIDEDHRDIIPTDENNQNIASVLDVVPSKEEVIKAQTIATTDFVRNKAALLFDTVMLDNLIGILEGTTVYSESIKVPNEYEVVNIDWASSLYQKVKFVKKENELSEFLLTVQITGFLTDDEAKELLKVCFESSVSLENTLKSITSKKEQRFNEVFYNLLKSEKTRLPGKSQQISDWEKQLKSGDISSSSNNEDNSAPKKRVAFLQLFMPYLRNELTYRFISETLTGLFELGRERTELLVSKILTTDDDHTTIYHDFENIRQQTNQASKNQAWAYLIPPADGEYIFVTDSAAVSIVIDDIQLHFTKPSDNSEYFWSDSCKLSASKAYKFSVSGVEVEKLSWKSTTSAISAIPNSALLPVSASENISSAVIKLKKAAMLIAGFNLNADEIGYLDDNKDIFDDLNFSRLTFPGWLRLDAYTRLRNSLPHTKTNLIEFFRWAASNSVTKNVIPPTDEEINKKTEELLEKIEELTRWSKVHVRELIRDNHFNIDQPKDYLTEKNLLKIQYALSVRNKIEVDVASLFAWGKPVSNFKKCVVITDKIRNTIRSHYNQTDWEQVIKPLNDKIRENQKNALIDYLLQNPELQKWGITDSDALFEFFLIDVEMSPSMETSRIKQAISSVQLFIQRCFLGLEKEHSSIVPSLLDRGRWEWMERYRVWEANRKVFLYPENWIESNLRDDKSQFFKELESELLQKDINKDSVKDALKDYLYKVDDVANMEVVGLFLEEKNKGIGRKLHVFSRTRNAPYTFYYRYFALDQMNWYPWEKVQVDIPSYDSEIIRNLKKTEVDEGEIKKTIFDVNPDYGNIKGNGCYLTPIVWNNRLLVFFPQIVKKPQPSLPLKQDTFYKVATEGEIKDASPSNLWEVKMAWSEYRNGKWTQKQVSNDAIYVSASYDDGEGGVPIEYFRFVAISGESLKDESRPEITNDIFIKIEYCKMTKMETIPDLLKNPYESESIFWFDGNKVRSQALPVEYIQNNADGSRSNSKLDLSFGLTGDIGYFHRTEDFKMTSLQTENNLSGQIANGYDLNFRFKHTGIYFENAANFETVAGTPPSSEFYASKNKEAFGGC